MMNELSNILHELNSKKVPLWMQMRFVEIFASMLAENLMQHGTKFIPVQTKSNSLIEQFQSQLKVKVKGGERKKILTHEMEFMDV